MRPKDQPGMLSELKELDVSVSNLANTLEEIRQDMRRIVWGIMAGVGTTAAGVIVAVLRLTSGH